MIVHLELTYLRNFLKDIDEQSINPNCWACFFLFRMKILLKYPPNLGMLATVRLDDEFCKSQNTRRSLGTTSLFFSVYVCIIEKSHFLVPKMDIWTSPRQVGHANNPATLMSSALGTWHKPASKSHSWESNLNYLEKVTLLKLTCLFCCLCYK